MSPIEPPETMTRELHPDRDLDAPREAPTSARQRTTRVLAVAGCLAAIIVLYLVAVRTQVGQRIDDASIVRHHLDRTPSKDVRVSSRTLLLATIILGPLVVWFGRAQRRRLVVTGSAVIASLLLAEVLRPRLSRPNFGLEDPLYGASYPSGHAAAVMGLALALVVLADERAVWRFLAPAIPAFVAALAVATPIHRPSDVAGGFVLALGTMAAVMWMSGEWRRPSAAIPVGSGPAWRWRSALVRALGLTALFLVGEQIALGRAHLTLVDLGWSFPVVVLALIGLSELTVGAFRVAMARW